MEILTQHRTGEQFTHRSTDGRQMLNVKATNKVTVPNVVHSMNRQLGAISFRVDANAHASAHALLLFRYNGFLPPGDRGRRRSKFVLYKRPQPTGVKKSKHYVVKTPHSSQVRLHSI